MRQGFFGEEAQRIQRGRDDVRVMIRYPESERKSLGDLEQMRIRTPTGDEVPFSAVASASMGRGFATIKRVDRRRAINVTAEVDETITDENKVLADIQAGFLPALLTEHRGVRYSLEGASANQAEAMEALAKGFVVALFVIYVLMAIPFGSYVQPLIVMSAVPFGVVGAIWGHMFMGMSMSMLSMCGVVALSGVVVNDSLVLVSFINKRRAAGDVPLRQAVIEAGVSRFRPILLTSLTTAAGVTPLMLEQSMQAKFLIPNGGRTGLRRSLCNSDHPRPSPRDLPDPRGLPELLPLALVHPASGRGAHRQRNHRRARAATAGGPLTRRPTPALARHRANRRGLRALPLVDPARSQSRLRQGP